MNKRERYEKDLDRLAVILRRRALTAGEVAEIFRVSKPTAYARIYALADRGCVFVHESARAGARGPEATRFRLTKGC